MLALVLIPGQSILIDGHTRISLHPQHAYRVKLCFEAPASIAIQRLDTAGTPVPYKRGGQLPVVSGQLPDIADPRLVEEAARMFEAAAERPNTMLALVLIPGQSILIDGHTRISLRPQHAYRVKLCFEAPASIAIQRLDTAGTPVP